MFTAVVVLPTPPFWLAIAIIRATWLGWGPVNLAPQSHSFHVETGRKTFHVETSYLSAGLNRHLVLTSTASVCSPGLIGVSAVAALERIAIIGRGGGG